MKLVCFGDSLTARKEGLLEPMFTAKLKENLPNFTIINAGVSGDNTFDTINRLERNVLQHHPDFVTILFGANDAAFHKQVALGDYKQNLTHIVQAIGSERSILLSTAPVDETVQYARTNAVLTQYADAVQQVANETRSRYIDFFSKMIALPDYQVRLKGIKNDGLHFGEAAYTLLAELISDIILADQLLKKELKEYQ
ncbi:DUF459 domain-containing protein [Paraliobacillus ryukyuensis]|uniref:DUF459 domain-containing protein n=1 Tax=Paraliobacillus ryukyuensis TaxID=200904 RepID=UPI0009A64892|nr:GDSL-type esterase/lipase family protein [Paraliobacillus ryukyuensis]